MRLRHVLRVVLAILLRVLHWHDLAHVRGAWYRVGQSRAAVCLVWRIRVLWHRSSTAREWTGHAATALVWSAAELVVALWVSHLLVLVGVAVATAAAALRVEAATVGTTHTAFSGKSSVMARLCAWGKRCLWYGSMSHVTL